MTSGFSVRSRVGEALALWRGPALADFAYESFVQDEIARLPPPTNRLAERPLGQAARSFASES